MTIPDVLDRGESRYRMAWHEYHEFTKHTLDKLRGLQHYLDWANMPNPFRHYEAVPVLDLPADPPAPQISALQVLEGSLGKRRPETERRFYRS